MPQVSNLSVLVSLKLRKNRLSAVPPELFSLESLSLLDLTGNAIRELPEEGLGSAVALKGLLLSGEFVWGGGRGPRPYGAFVVVQCGATEGVATAAGPVRLLLM